MALTYDACPLKSKKTTFREKDLVETFTKLMLDNGVYSEGENLDQFTSKMSILKVEDGKEPDEEGVDAVKKE